MAGQTVEYNGSQIFSCISENVGLSVDKVNFIFCQLFALLLSDILRRYIANPRWRLWYCLVCGFLALNFCFGHEILFVFTSALIGWTLLNCVNDVAMPWIVLGTSMTYLSVFHLKRQFYDGSTSSIDITGPLMVLTQRITSLAFSIQDGKVTSQSNSNLTKMQERFAIKSKPSFLEYMSYCFQFQSVLAGPPVMYRDFHDFIYSPHLEFSGVVILKKVISSLVFAGIYVKLGPIFHIDHIRSSTFLYETSIMYKLYYLMCATTVERGKYYHAWILADAVCNTSGLGLDRVTKKWDLVTNVKPVGVEFGLNLKESLDDWNIGTMKWLRLTAYERCKGGSGLKTIATYGLSAFWHGFYPGYYITFFSGALFTSAARLVRRAIRPIFLGSWLKKNVYHGITFCVTRLVLAYASFSFVVLDFTPSILLLAKMYFLFHIAALSTIFALPRAAKRWQSKSAEQKVHSKSSTHLKDNGEFNESGAHLTLEKTKDIHRSNLNGLSLSAQKLKTG